MLFFFNDVPAYGLGQMKLLNRVKIGKIKVLCIHVSLNYAKKQSIDSSDPLFRELVMDLFISGH